MDYLQFMAMCMQTCQEFAQKMAHVTLTEYEAMCYESCCRSVEEFMRIQRWNFIISQRQFKKDNPDFSEEESE